MTYAQLIKKINSYLDETIECKNRNNLIHMRNMFRYESRYNKIPDTDMLKSAEKWVLETLKAA